MYHSELISKDLHIFSYAPWHPERHSDKNVLWVLLNISCLVHILHNYFKFVWIKHSYTLGVRGLCSLVSCMPTVKVHIFGEGYKIWRDILLSLDDTKSQQISKAYFSWHSIAPKNEGNIGQNSALEFKKCLN